tara:strand:- start:119 stop:292 length:174 start_codon:yes stop_codon:yes gene_type:complete
MGKYQRRHYVDVATLLNRTMLSPKNLESLTKDFVELFENDNPNFNPDTFRDVALKPR